MLNRRPSDIKQFLTFASFNIFSGYFWQWPVLTSSSVRLFGSEANLVPNILRIAKYGGSYMVSRIFNPLFLDVAKFITL